MLTAVLLLPNGGFGLVWIECNFSTAVVMGRDYPVLTVFEQSVLRGTSVVGE